MSKKWFRTIKIPFDEYEIGVAHGVYNISSERCAELTETKDGCPACQEEYDEASELAMKKLSDEGLETLDILLDNRPGLDIDEDEFWEFEVQVQRA